MKKWFGAAVLAVPLLTLPAQAQICCPPYRVTGGVSLNFNVNPSCTLQLGPWYQYWPLAAHFQTPAMCHYPYWPPPMALPGVVPVPPPGAKPPTALRPPPGAVPPPPGPAFAAPAIRPANFHTFQPVGYSTQAPSYWYDR